MEANNLIFFEATPGLEVCAAVTRLSRYHVVFEVYDPNAVFRISQVLEPFKILVQKQPVYDGRAVISSAVNIGRGWLCEATLEESWRDIDLTTTAPRAETLRTDFDHFLRIIQQNFKVRPEFKVAVGDMQMLLLDLKQWVEQVELSLRASSRDDPGREHEVLEQLQKVVLPAVGILFERFEEIAGKVEDYLEPPHRTYAKRVLHPIVLCSPFMFRTFRKPLGYAGDYEMVNMMLRDPYEGTSLFAKLLNAFFLETPPVIAHRNRIQYLIELLVAESGRRGRQGALKIFNLGCGPAKEVQEFIRRSDWSHHAQFTLLDFNEETLRHTGNLLIAEKESYARMTRFQMVKKSVAEVLREGARGSSVMAPRHYDLVYCAGLFDYLSDPVCQRLLAVFYDMLVPGGLLAATNVEQGNPSRNWMEYVVDWHLVYRSGEQLLDLCPKEPSPEAACIKADPTGVNIFLEVRKPENGQ